MKKFKLVGIGEVLWDLLPGGPQLGGAPANFVYHANSLGAKVALISRVGSDDFGRDILARFSSIELSAKTIQMDENAPTGTVTVTLSEQGVPEFIIHENVAWDRLLVTIPALETVLDASAVCFGTLGQRNPIACAAIQELVAAAPAGAWRVFDVNLRQHFFSQDVIEKSLALASVLKVNETELPCLAKMWGLCGDERSLVAKLAERHHLRVVAYTRGGGGSLLFVDGRWSDHPGVPTNVVDTVGAGDAFTAAMTLGLLAGWPLDEINHHANEVAAYVASRAGATPDLPERLRAPFTDALRGRPENALHSAKKTALDPK